MTKLVFGFLLIGSLLTGNAFAATSPIDCQKLLIPQIRHNLLLNTSRLEHGAIPFDRLTIDQFRPAFTRGIRMVRERYEAIRNNPEAPTFANTIEAIESANEPLVRTEMVFENYLSTNSNPALEAIAEKMQPKLSRLKNSLFFDEAIFKRVDELYRDRERLNLDVEQKTLLTDLYLGFVRNGAKLDPATKAKVGEIDQKLSLLGETFRKNVNTAINSFVLEITDPKELAGLPKSAIEAAADAAKKRGKEGAWIFTLHIPSYLPFMKYAENDALREKLWRAYASRASSGMNDNRPVILEITKLREKRARLIGYKTHADYVLEVRMAHDKQTVEDFLLHLANVYRPVAQKELEELQNFAGPDHKIKPWNLAYYSEKLRQSQYSYNEEELKQYFSLDNVIKGAFYAANRLYGVTFTPRTDLPTWNENVRAYEVKDRDGKYLGLFYLDPHPRASKRPGAFMSLMQEPGEFEGKNQRPHVINVANLTPPTENAPALLTPREVTTIFHELGHGLHALLSNTRYRSLAGPNVPWDFVELPSQLNENWAFEPEALKVYARNYKTGAPIPTELINKVRRAENFQVGLSGLRQVKYGLIDMGWHSKDLSELKNPEDVTAFERNVLGPYQLLPLPTEALSSTAFNHIFAGGYSAGYYSYKWADVLVADAFDAFKEKGIFNKEVANRFRTEVLEKGGTEDVANLYRRFRGRAPDPDALLRKEGLIH